MRALAAKGLLIGRAAGAAFASTFAIGCLLLQLALPVKISLAQTSSPPPDSKPPASAAVSPLATPTKSSGSALGLRGSYGASLSTHVVDDLYRRTSLHASYEGPVQLALGGHLIGLSGLAEERLHASEFSAGTDHVFWQRLELAARFGLFSVAENPAFGMVEAGVLAPKQLRFGLGLSRQPLLLEMPLYGDAQDLMRDEAHIGLTWAEYASLRLAVRREADYAAHELHEFVGRIPLYYGLPGSKGRRKSFARLRVPVSIESHPRANPNYPSDPRILRAGVGVEFGSGLWGGRWRGDLSFDYSLAYVSLRGGSDSRRTGGLEAAGALRGRLKDELYLFMSGRYGRRDDEQQLRNRFDMNSVLLGLQLGETEAGHTPEVP